MPAGYTVESAGNIALSAATAKTVLAIVNSSTGLIRIVELCASFDGVSATAVPIVVELCKSTQAGAGTSTPHTIIQGRGPTRTVQATAARNYTVEPTVLTTWKRWLVRADGGLLLLQFPLGREPEIITASNAWCLRCTAPATVNFQGYMEWEEG